MQKFGNYIITETKLIHAEQLENLQKKVFPTLSPDEWMNKSHYLNHIKIFSEGQLVVLDGEKVICGSTTMRTNFSDTNHTFKEITDNMSISTHNPNGEWIYGLDVSVDPDYQRQGIGRAVYNYRQEIAKKLNTKGQLTVGMTNGYINYAEKFSIEEYCKLVIEGKIIDPTVSSQMKYGFKVIKPIYNYLDDPKCGNAGILMYWPVDEKIKI